MHLVGFIIRIYHDARSSECQMFFTFFIPALPPPTFNFSQLVYNRTGSAVTSHALFYALYSPKGCVLDWGKVTNRMYDRDSSSHYKYTVLLLFLSMYIYLITHTSQLRLA